MSLQLHLVFLVLLAAVMHAAWNAIVKTSGDRIRTATCNLVTGTFLGVFLLPLVPVPSAEVWPYLIVSVAAHYTYYLFLIGAYRFGDLSHVYPVARGSAPLVVTVLAAVTAGEVPSVTGVAAITMMSLGVASLSFDRGSAREYRTGPVMLALATGFLIALYTVIDGLGIRAAGSPWTYIVWLTFPGRRSVPGLDGAPPAPGRGPVPAGASGNRPSPAGFWPSSPMASSSMLWPRAPWPTFRRLGKRRCCSRP